MNIKRFYLPPFGLLSVLLTTIVIAGCGKAESQSASKPGGPPPAPPVTVAAALEKEVNEWDEFTGRIEAIERVELRPRVSGYIDRVNFAQGSEVKKGDLLFEIDPRSFEQELRRAEAEAARSRTKAELAAQELARFEKLIDSGAVSRQEYDQALSAKRDADASLRSIQTAIEAAQLNLSYAKVRAPISGRTGRAELTTGNFVTAGQSVLTSIVSLDPIYVTFEADEQVFLKYVAAARNTTRPGSRATKNAIFLGLSNEEGFPHKGYVDFIDNRLNPQTGTILGRAVFANRDRRFTPGLFARLKVIGSGTYKAVLIDDRAVGTDQDKKFVLVLGPDQKVAYRGVKLGPMVDGLRSVREGLKAGEVIVVNGLQRVRPGMPVTPQQVTMGEDAPKPANGNGAKPAAPQAKK